MKDDLIVRPRLNVPQARFMALPHKFTAFVAGFGSGKTWVGGAKQCKHFWENPGQQLGYFAPTYTQIKDIYYPTIDEVAHNWGLSTKVAVGNREVHFYSGGTTYRGTTICRSLDKPETIVGFKIARGMVDELDIMNIKKAEQAWRKMIARLRLKFNGLNGLDVTTTPEGFKFVYQQWVKAVQSNPEMAKLYGMVQASTYDNEKNLPDDYIDSLRMSYPQQLIDAYLNGQFVNLTSGAVYPMFDRKKNHTNAQIKPGEVLHVGMDFNVQKMSAAINVIRDNAPFALSELSKVRDTPDMALKLRQRFPKDVWPEIVIYPDVSGQNTSSKSASESDFTILRKAGFKIMVGTVNSNGNAAAGSIKDRVNAVNAQILSGTGRRQLRINTDNCPTLTENLEQQVYDNNGFPDKKSDTDHMPDAQGYFIVRRWPIVKPVMYTNLGVATNG